MNPYKNLPGSRFWRTGVAECDPTSLTGIHQRKWDIAKSDTIVTMGSCFAQHIGRKLKSLGCNVPFFDSPDNIKSQNFSANYGNVYTVRQALQLIKESVGEQQRSEDCWQTADGFIDPFRPNVFASEFSSADEVRRARKEHLHAVSEAVASADIFIFTLGLTEAWIINACGSVLPTAPGVLGGQFDEQKYSFRNFTYEEVQADLLGLMAAITNLRNGKPYRLLLTVSPVPLTATAEDRHVLLSSTYSKAVLRAVAGSFTADHDYADYFPSFEIVTNPKSIATNYLENLREVSPSVVDNVMSHFERSYFDAEDSAVATQTSAPSATDILRAAEVGNVDCEDAILDQFAAEPAPHKFDILDSKVLVFGNSHIGSFKEALSDTSLIDTTCFAPVNFVTNDPFSDEQLQKNRFREFIFDHPGLWDFRAFDAQYLVVVGFGVFGNSIISALGPVEGGYEGCDGRSINVQLEAGKALTEDEIDCFRRRIRHWVGSIHRVSEAAGFEKTYWVVSPDFPEACARFRLGDQFVDSGTYNEIKAAYTQVFDEFCAGLDDRIEFLFFGDELYADNGFLSAEFNNIKPWDIHPTKAAYKASVSYLEQQLSGLIRPQKDAA